MALYNFVDTVSEGASPGLPAEAVSLNGVFLENVIPGFRTLSVRGREQQDVDLYEIDNDYHDGGLYRRKRYRSRTLTVKYQLIAASNTAFRNAYNRLHALLDEEEMQVIFNDEPDKYYTGTCSDIREVDEGANAVTGEYEIFCADPLKYSVEEYTVEANENGLMEINYDGTAPAFPKLKANINSALGYVSFVDGMERIIQIGNPEETDDEEWEQSETLINDSFTGSLPSGWTSNNATVTDSTVASNPQVGTTNSNSAGRYGATFGSGTGWHGPSLTKQIPADSNSHVGAANFTLTWHHTLWKTALKKVSELNIMLTGTINGVKQNIATMHFLYNTQASYNMKGECFILGSRKKLWEQAVKQGNKYSGSTGLACSIKKSGKIFTFSFFGTTFSISVDGSEDYEVTEVSMWFKQSKTTAVADRCHVKDLKFVKDHVEKWRDVPNPFSDGDEVVADCGPGAILVNGIEQYGLGALGNDWETFALHPGPNLVQGSWSDWGDMPTFSLTYRKAYL